MERMHCVSLRLVLCRCKSCLVLRLCPAAALHFAPGKVVDRHWYNKNKHIFPASHWAVVRMLQLQCRVGELLLVWAPALHLGFVTSRQ